MTVTAIARFGQDLSFVPVAHRWSQRDSFRKHSFAERNRQISQRQKVDARSKQVFKFNLQCAKIKQRGTRQRVDEQANVASGFRYAGRDRSEHAQVVRAVSWRCGEHRGALILKRLAEIRAHMIAYASATAQLF